MTAIQIRKRDWTSRFSFLFVLAITAVFGYLLFLFLPSWLGHRQMRETTATIVRRGALQRLEIADIRAQLVENARLSRLPEDTRIELVREGRILSAHISYTRTISLPFYDFKWPLVINIVDTGL
jgi:hypothetical protein